MRKTRGTPSELSENEQSASASSPRGISANRYLLSTPQTTEFQPSPFPASSAQAIRRPKALNINPPTRDEVSEHSRELPASGSAIVVEQPSHEPSLCERSSPRNWPGCVGLG